MSQSYTRGVPIDTDPNMSANTDLLVPSQAAVVAYVTSQLGGGSVNSVTGTAPIASSGGPNPDISISKATAVQDGYLATADFIIFNSKQPGSPNLTSLAGLTFASTSFVKMTGANTFTLDTNTYLTTALTSLNALTGTTQTFATGTTGSDFGISSVGTVHTFNIPDASATARGLITTGTQTFVGQKTFNSVLTVSTATIGSSLIVVNTNTSNALAVGNFTGISGNRGVIATTNGAIQYTGRSSTHTDRELRLNTFTDGNTYIQQTVTTGTATSDLIIRTQGDGGTNNGALRFNLGTTAKMAVTSNGIAVGSQAGALSGSAYLHLMAGAAGANNAPLKFTSGTNLTTAETGAMEYNGTNLFFTRTGTTRENVFVGNDAAAAPTTAAWATPTNYYGANITNTLGEPNSWASVVIGGVTYKIPLYT